MGQIKLNGMEFFAYHGCYRSESVIGNTFIVDITMDTDMKKASDSDNLSDALNYAEVYELIKQEMAIRSCLLEHLTNRILNRLFDCFPQLICAELSIAKLHPPVGGKVHSAAVIQKLSRNIT